MEGWREGGLRLQAESLGQTLWLGLRLQVRGLGVQRLRLLSPFNPGGGIFPDQGSNLSPALAGGVFTTKSLGKPSCFKFE